METKINTNKTAEFVRRTFYGKKYQKWIKFCEKLLIRYKIENYLAPEDVLQELAVKIFTERRKLKEEITMDRSIYFLIKSEVYNYQRHFRSTKVKIINKGTEAEFEKTATYESLSYTEKYFESIETEEIKEFYLKQTKNEEEYFVLYDIMMGMKRKDISNDLGIGEIKIKNIKRELRRRLVRRV